MDVIRTAFNSWKADPTRAALVRLLETSQHLVFGVCFEIVRHRQDAEDTSQRVLIEIQKGIDSVADAEHFLRRVRLTAFRTALNSRRDRRRRWDRERKASDMNPSAPLPEDVREAIHEAMSALDDESRALVIEHYFEKATLDDIAARRGVSATAIWKRIRGIKNRLREGLVLAGLASAASKAEACLDSASLVAPSANLVTAATIGGGLMATKTSTTAVATIVAALALALGLGGGLAIQAAREPAPPREHARVEPDTKPPEEVGLVPEPGAAPRAPDSTADPSPPSADSPEDRLKMAQEIWAKMSSPRFWKDQIAQDETLPKLKFLGPDLAGFFIERYREDGLKKELKSEAIRLAMACGGSLAADLLLELMQAPHSEETKNFRLAPVAALSAVRDSFTNPPKDFPVSEALWNSAMALKSSESGWDRVLALSVLSMGKREDWMPTLMHAVGTDSSGLVRSETVYLLAQRGDAGVLAFLRDHRSAISQVPLDSRIAAGSAALQERERLRMERVIDEAILELERRFKR